MEIKYLDKRSDDMVDILVSKEGPSGRPEAMILASPSISLDKLTGAIQKAVTSNTDLREKLGLKACQRCISGIHLGVYEWFDPVIRVDLGKI